MQQKTVQILSITLFIALLLWGGFTALYYLGTTYHSYNLLNDTGFQMLAKACGETDNLCRGFAAFFPFIIRSIARLAPFGAYVLISLIAFATYFGWKWLSTNEVRYEIRWKPWKALLLVIGLLWLMFTVITWGPERNEQSVRFLVEPRADTYTVSEQALAELQADFTSFEERGCLELVGDTVSGAKAYLFRHSCIQASFVTRVLPQVLFVLVLLFEFLVLGRFLLSLLGIRRSMTMQTEAIFSAALGACAWIAILWMFAVLYAYQSILGWVLMAGVPVVLYRHSLYWLKSFIRHEWTSSHGPLDLLPFIVWFLISYTALGFISVVRPFPIGWDDLGSYLNRPHLLVSYGRFIPSMSGFDWAYLTSLGYLLFGYNSIFGTTASMMVNWTAGLIALLSVVVFTQHFLGQRRGWLAASLYYALPLVGHFSFADMKIDNAVFAFGALAMLATLWALLPKDGEEEQADTRRFTDVPRLLLLAGVLVGFAMATKITAAMVFLTVFSLVLGLTMGSWAFLGSIGFSFLIFGWMGQLNPAEVLGRITGGMVSGSATSIFTMFCALITLGGIGYAWFRRPQSSVRAITAVVALGIGIAIAMGPWIIRNNILRGNLIPRLEFGAPNDLVPNMLYRSGRESVADYGQDIRVLPPELRPDTTLPACTSTGAQEELDRYWGHDGGISHYLLLPWRTVMNLDSTGYYVTTMAALLLFPLLLLLPYFWTRQGRWLRWLTGGTALLIVQWMFLANGIPWYGIGMFLGLCIGLEVLIAKAPDLFSRITGSILIGLSLLMSVGFRLGQFEQQRNMYEYPMGKISGPALQEITVANYDDIVRLVEERRRTMKDRPYLYRIGTFIPYFIPQNLEAIGMNDHQLDTFNCLYAERDAALTVRRLKALGFNAFILDLNTATIEADPQGSLHKKVELFQNFVNDPATGLQVVLNDGKGVAYILIP